MSGNGPRNRKGPKSLGELLGALIAARGYGQHYGQAQLETAWANAVGSTACRQTRVGSLRRGVLTVTVTHPALLEELAAFRKAALLSGLQAALPGVVLRDIRFRIGPLDGLTD